MCKSNKTVQYARCNLIRTTRFCAVQSNNKPFNVDKIVFYEIYGTRDMFSWRDTALLPRAV